MSAEASQSAPGDPLLVTGATGFIGSHLVERLVRRGYRVRALVRPQTAAGWLDDLGVEVTRGDLLEPDAVHAAASGCAGILHVAALAGWVRNPRRYEPINVEGTEIVVEAAREVGVARLLHTSSIATIGEQSGDVAREDTPHRGTFLREYERTKHLAEELVRREAANGLPAVIVNPTGVIGPRSLGITAQVFVSYLNQKLPTMPNPTNRVNLVHVGDVADGTIAAYERGRLGERYILGGDNVTIGEMFRCCEEITGVPPPSRTLPRPAETAIATTMDLWGKATGRTPPLTRDLLRVARHGMIADSSKAAEELGYAPRPLRDGLEDTLRWYVQEGYADIETF